MTLQSHHQNREFSNWLEARRARSGEGIPFSIVIESPCLVCQPRVAESLTRYLNEFDERSDGSTWLFLNDERHEQIRKGENLEKQDFSDFLLSCGNIVFESTDFSTSHLDSKHIFQVFLSCKEPGEGSHHLWLNAKRIAPETLTLMIANSFIDWADRDRNWTSLHQQETV